MKYFSILEPDLEPGYKLIAQRPPDYDPGDTAQREGMLALGAYILHRMGEMDDAEFQFIKDRYAKVLSLLDDPNHPGLLRRYPNPSYWGGLSDRLSRDQSTPNVVGMGLLNRTALARFFWAHLKFRGLLFTTNTRRNWAWPPGHPEYDEKEYRWKLPDLTFFGFWANYIRGFNCRLLYPLLWLFDLDMLVNSAIKVWYYSKDPTNSDDLNHHVDLYMAELRMPTLWSKLAFWLYQKRPYPAQDNSIHPVATNPAQACFNHYFRNRPGNYGPYLERVYVQINDYMAKSFRFWKLWGKWKA